jgi:hypothetical protein
MTYDNAHTQNEGLLSKSNDLTFRPRSFIQNLVGDFSTDEPYTLLNVALVRVSCLYVALGDTVGTKMRPGLSRGISCAVHVQGII